MAEIISLISQNAGTNLLSLGIYVAGMVLYGLTIWTFYRHLAKKEILILDLKKPERGFWRFLAYTWEVTLYLLQSIIIFPIITLLWFTVLGSFILFLSKSNDVGQILLVTMTIIASSRLTAYFNEDLARELAKLIPIALLGVFIVDPSYFSMQATLNKFYSLPKFLPAMIQYFIAVVTLEFLLNTAYRLFWRKKELERKMKEKFSA
jgi:hypothetical protein